MKKSQSGFTLIELVVVIVLLGILGVTALGKFQDLSDDAAQAAVTGVASELSAASAINFAEGTLSTVYGAPDIDIAHICVNGTLQTLLQSATFPADITASGTGNCTTTAPGAGPGSTVTCTLTHAKGGGLKTANVSIVCGG